MATDEVRGEAAGTEGLIDVNTWWGYDPRTGVTTTPEEVKRACQQWGVVTAYTHSVSAVLFDQEEGNGETLELCARDRFFRPVGVICPTGVDAVRQVARAREAGFRVVRLFPEVHGYAADGEACGVVLDACAEAGLVVMAPSFGAGVPALTRALEGRAGRYILTNNRYHCLGEVMALAERLPGVYVEVSEVNTPDGIALLWEAFTEERLVWGSGYPMLAVGSAALRLRGCGLGEEEIGRIGSGNARRLLEAGR